MKVTSGVPGRLRWAAACALAAAGLGAVAPAHAIFSDDEARRAIVDLRARVTQEGDQTRARLAELASTQTAMLEQLQALRRSLLELNNEIVALRAEQATLRGANEQLAREVAELQSRSRDLGQTLDDRLRKIEPVRVTVDGEEFLVDPEERRLHDEALATLRGGDFEKGANALAAFLKRYPNSRYEPSARFWLGTAQYGRRDLKEAVVTFRAFVSTSPSHPRAPEALLALANAQVELKDTRAARRTLDELNKMYPQSEAAAAGRERLKRLPAPR